MNPTTTTTPNYYEPEMVKAAFSFWFTDTEHIRSPFPEYIREKLETDATKKFATWCSSISADAKKDINDEIIAEKFEEITFELALDMVLTEDEKLTIRYPFMIRLGDAINVKSNPETTAESLVVDRWYEKKGDTAFLKVKLRETISGGEWETEFELPE